MTTEDYLAARWIAKPANLFDNDIPIMVSAAYLFTTPERAKDMQHKPVYILNHASSRATPRSLTPTLEEVEAETAKTGRKLYEGAGISAADLSFENMYDGFTLFHQFHLEGLGYRGMKCGEALDFYQTDISIAGPNPVSPQWWEHRQWSWPFLDAHRLHPTVAGPGGGLDRSPGLRLRSRSLAVPCR